MIFEMPQVFGWGVSRRPTSWLVMAQLEIVDIGWYLDRSQPNTEPRIRWNIPELDQFYITLADVQIERLYYIQ